MPCICGAMLRAARARLVRDPRACAGGHGAPVCAADGGRGGRAPSAAGAAGDSAAPNCANAKSTAPSCPDCGHLQDGGEFDLWLVYHGMFGPPTTPRTYPFARFGPPEFPFAWFAQVPRAAMLCNCARRAVGIEHWKCGRFRLAASLFGIDCMTDPESALLLRDVGVLDWAVAPVRSFADILSEPELDVLIGDSKALYYAALGDAHPTLAGVAQVLVHASASRRCACTALRAYAEKCQSRTGDVNPAHSDMEQWCCYGASLLLSACVGGALRACIHGRCHCALTQPLCSAGVELYEHSPRLAILLHAMSQWVDKVYLDLVLWQGEKARGGVSAEDLDTYAHVYTHGYASASGRFVPGRCAILALLCPYAAVAVSQC